MRDRVVHDRRPQQGEDQERLEAHALGERAGDQRRGDDGEHHLEDHERLVRDRRGVVGVGLEAHAVQPDPAQTANQAQTAEMSGPKARL